MGGGVSLGSFSGAALSEALKLVLMAEDGNGKLKYDKVIIDVFSGASAGALSLVLMLRVLAQPSGSDCIKAAGKLTREYGDRFTRLPEPRKSQVIAAQVVQDIQEDVWVNEINIEGLLGNGCDLTYEPALLDRRAVDTIARNRIAFQKEPDFSRKQLLAERVLLCCSLSNMSALTADASAEFPGKEVGYIGLADGMCTKTHRELRVFDLYFEVSPTLRELRNREKHPSRWCRYHHDSEKDGRIGDLRSNKTWAKMAATAIACGAFPGAFEPVVLKRDDWEFGKRLWPKALEKAGKTSHEFTYVDGGVFNNEPIREAFRLASFIDSQTPDSEFERLIIFVDPFVEPGESPLRVPGHQAWFCQKPNSLGKWEATSLERRTSLERLVPNLTTLLSAVSTEARAIEADKIFQTRHRFQLRDAIRKQVGSSLTLQPTRRMAQELIKWCRKQLVSDQEELMLPPGPLSLEGELARIIWEERKTLKPLVGKNGSAVRAALEFLERDEISPARDGTDDCPIEAANAHLWLRALSYVAVDLVMDLEGKWDDAQLVAIAPFMGLADAPVAINLPGGALSGFAGFMSPTAGRFAVDVARYCAHEFLFQCGVIEEKPSTNPPPRQLSPGMNAQFMKELDQGIGKLQKRVEQFIKNSHLVRIAPGLNGIILSQVATMASNWLATLKDTTPAGIQYELRIVCAGINGLQFDRKGIGHDIDAVVSELDGKLTLITYASFNQNGCWSGPDVNAGQTIEVVQQRYGVIDKRYCTLQLPDSAQREEAGFFSYPIFEVSLANADNGKNLPASRWRVVSGVKPLESSVFIDAP